MLIGGAALSLDRPGACCSPRARAPARPRARAAGARPALLDAAPRGAGRRLPDRPLDVPGRVRLRRAAVPPALPADADRARRGLGARRRAHAGSAAAARSAPSRSSSSCAACSRCIVGAVLRPDAAALPALPRRGAARRGVALAIAASSAARSRFGAVAGVLIGTVGAGRRVGAGRTSGCRCPGRRRCCPRGDRARLSPASPAALLGAFIGIGAARCGPSRSPRGARVGCRARRAGGRRARRASALHRAAASGVNARVHARRAPGRAASARSAPRSTPRPADAADDANWLTTTAWQGGGARGRPPGARRRGRLPHARAGPGLRRLEGRCSASTAAARWSASRSTCPTTRRSRPRACRRRAQLRRARSCATSRSSSARRSRARSG